MHWRHGGSLWYTDVHLCALVHRAIMAVQSGNLNRGDSARQVEYSDLYHHVIEEVGPDPLNVLAIVSNQGKHNQVRPHR